MRERVLQKIDEIYQMTDKLKMSLKDASVEKKDLLVRKAIKTVSKADKFITKAMTTVDYSQRMEELLTQLVDANMELEHWIVDAVPQEETVIDSCCIATACCVVITMCAGALSACS